MRRSSLAFTLIELLVVIAIIAIVAAILFPVFARNKLAAKKAGDLANMKAISIGLQMYLNDADDYYPVAGFNEVYANYHAFKFPKRQRGSEQWLLPDALVGYLKDQPVGVAREQFSSTLLNRASATAGTPLSSKSVTSGAYNYMCGHSSEKIENRLENPLRVLGRHAGENSDWLASNEKCPFICGKPASAVEILRQPSPHFLIRF